MSQRMAVIDLMADSSRIASSLNVCSTDPRFLSWANEAEERMANQGRWFGTVTEVQFCVDRTGCFTLPREVVSLERVKVNGHNIDIQNGWFTYTRLLGGDHTCAGCNAARACGASVGSCGHIQMQEREGTQASYARTSSGANKVLRTYPGGLEDIGKTITFYGYDKNNVWVKTGSGANVQDGETVTLAMPFADTVTRWGEGSPMAVRKDVTSWRTLVYEYDTVTGASVGIGEYQPGETRPSYRLAYIPGLRNVSCGTNCTTEGGEGRVTITALARLQHVPLIGDGDWLLMQNLAAYKSAMIAVKAWEEGDVAKFNYYFFGTQSSSKNGRGVLRVVNRGGAIPLLQAELRTNTSDRTNAFITIDESNRYVREMIGFR